MTQIIASCILTLFVFTALMQPLAAATMNSEARDFGLRLGTGVVSGLGASANPAWSIATDVYALSPFIRLTFGTTLIAPTNAYAPWFALHHLGIETIWDLDTVLLYTGVAYEKSYLQDGRNGFSGTRGLSANLGIRIPGAERHDWLLQLSYHPQNPLQQVVSDPGFPLSPVWLMQSGWQGYF